MGRQLLWRSIPAVCVLLAWLPQVAQGYIVGGRWTNTATNGSVASFDAKGVPVTLTWSFAPDGTQVPADNGTVGSNLLRFLDTNFGAGPGGNDLTQRPWFHIFQESFDRLSAVAGLTFVYEPKDNGSNFGAAGSLGVRGDIRLGGRSYGSGSSTLASNFYPDYGDMMVNTDQASYFRSSSDNYRRFRNTLMHELMHGVGISHVESSTSGFLIEPALSTDFDGPQLDDILALQRVYGDTYEKNGGNDTGAKATPLGALTWGKQTIVGQNIRSTAIPGDQTGIVSIDDNSDVDIYSFSLEETSNVTLTVVPRGANYMVGPQDGTQSTYNSITASNLAFSLYSGGTLLHAADVYGAGINERIIRQLDPGTYVARITGAQDDIQLYQFVASSGAAVARNLTWTGGASGAWNVNQSQSFDNGNNADVFRTGDNVAFDESGSGTVVHVSADVSAGNIVVNSAGNYLFNGTGRIAGGSLAVRGGGTVTLATNNNSYAEPTTIEQGTLRISGDPSQMTSAISVAAGARVVFDANSSGAVGSVVTLTGDGALEIAAGRAVELGGTLTIDGSGTVRADASAAAVLSGPVTAGSADGVLTLDVQDAAKVRLGGPIGLGGGRIAKLGAGEAELAAGSSYAGRVDVAAGTLRLSDTQPFSGSLHIADSAFLQLGEGVTLSSASALSGSGSVGGNLHIGGTLAPGDAIGALRVEGDVSMDAGTVTAMEIGGLGAGGEYDVLDVSGLASLGGTLQVSLANDFVPSVGDSFALVSGGSVSGSFDVVATPSLAPELAWHLEQTASELLLSVHSSAVVHPADFNADGSVDDADLAAWSGRFGQQGDATGGDADGDSFVDGSDFLAWQQQLTGPAPQAASAAVPEPAGLLLLSVAAVGCVGAMRRRPVWRSADSAPRGRRREIVLPTRD